MNDVAEVAEEFEVRIERKDTSHPYYKQGSDFGIVIDGIQGPVVDLFDDETYIFNVFTPGHPFYLTLSDKGGLGAPKPLTDPIQRGELEIFTSTRDYPNKFFYQCASHNYMGWKVEIDDSFTDD